MVESLLNTVSESKYPMMEMDQAFDLIFSKGRELFLEKSEQEQQIAIETKSIDEIQVGDILA